MKGVPKDSPELKGSTSPTNPFGIKGSPDTGTLKAGPTEKRVQQNTAETRWLCATWIASYAFPAARKGNASEVRFLAEQTQKAFRGERKAVECPDLPVPPKVVGVRVGQDAYEERFYENVLTSTVSHAEETGEAREIIKRAGYNPDEVPIVLEKKIKEAKTRPKQDRPVPDKSIVVKREEKKQPQEAGKEKGKDEDDPLVAMAERAMQDITRLNKKMDGNEALSAQVQNNPAIAKEAIQKIQR